MATSPTRKPETLAKFSVGVDLGSNTLRAVKRDCITGAFVSRYERIVRTADGLEKTGKISEAASTRVIEAIEEAKATLGFEGAMFRAVSTEALRKASNQQEVLKKIEANTGISFEVIDGKEEAALTLKAVQGRLEALGKKSDSLVLVDIGGASTELTFLVAKQRESRSFPLGIVTLAQRYPTLSELRRHLPKEMHPISTFVQEWMHSYPRPKHFIATAGTPTTVMALKLGMEYHNYDASRINGGFLERADLEATLQHLLAMEPPARNRAVGVGRADLISAGILIYEELFEILGFTHCLVIDDGLREGVALALCEEWGALGNSRRVSE